MSRIRKKIPGYFTRYELERRWNRTAYFIDQLCLKGLLSYAEIDGMVAYKQSDVFAFEAKDGPIYLAKKVRNIPKKLRAPHKHIEEIFAQFDSGTPRNVVIATSKRTPEEIDELWAQWRMSYAQAHEKRKERERQDAEYKFHRDVQIEIDKILNTGDET